MAAHGACGRRAQSAAATHSSGEHADAVGGGRRQYSSEQLLFNVPANADAGRLAQQQRGGVRRGDGEIFMSVEPATPPRLHGGELAEEEAAAQSRIARSPRVRHRVNPRLPGMYDGAGKFSYGGGLDDSYLSLAANKQMSKSTIFTENSYLKAFPDKEKAATVAKLIPGGA